MSLPPPHKTRKKLTGRTNITIKRMSFVKVPRNSISPVVGSNLRAFTDSSKRR